MKITEYLKVQNCALDLKASTKEEAVRELVGVLLAQGVINDPEDFIKHIFEREQLGSTGIGKRVAVPHSRTISVKGLVMAFGISRQGIDFHAPDKELVNFVFLMGTNHEEMNIYLKVMAKLSKMLQSNSIREELFAQGSAEDIMEVFKKHEQNLAVAV